MGDWLQRLVDLDVSADEARELGKRVLAHLIEQGVVGRDRSRCGLGPDCLAHPPGPLWIEALAEPNSQVAAELPNLAVNGVELVVGRYVHWSTGDVVRVFCPTCGEELSSSDFLDAVGRWAEGRDRELVRCQSCLVATPVELVTSVPAWALANLAVVFWNWPRLHDEFITSLRTILSPRSLHQWTKL